MKKLFLLIGLLVTTQVFAVNVQKNQTATQKASENATESLAIPQTLDLETLNSKKEKMTWKERKAFKILNKRIQKAKQKKSGDIGGFVYTVGLIIVILGLIGLVLGLLDIAGLGIGIGGILLGILLMLIGKFLL